jgi:hypothetical protein
VVLDTLEPNGGEVEVGRHPVANAIGGLAPAGDPL